MTPSASPSDNLPSRRQTVSTVGCYSRVVSTHLDPTRSADPVLELSAALAPRYRLERPLAPGGTTTAWLAQAVDGGDPVVVKVLLPELAARTGAERFVSEMFAASRFRHPSALPILDAAALELGTGTAALYYRRPLGRRREPPHPARARRVCCPSPRRSGTAPSWRRPSPRRTRRGWCTATCARRTCCSVPRAPASPTSAWLARSAPLGPPPTPSGMSAVSAGYSTRCWPASRPRAITRCRSARPAATCPRTPSCWWRAPSTGSGRARPRSHPFFALPPKRRGGRRPKRGSPPASGRSPAAGSRRAGASSRPQCWPCSP